MPSEVRLEKNWSMPVYEGAIDYKILTLQRKFGEFPVLAKFSLCCT